MYDCCVKNYFRPFNSLIKTDRLQTLLPNRSWAAKKNPPIWWLRAIRWIWTSRTSPFVYVTTKHPPPLLQKGIPRTRYGVIVLLLLFMQLEWSQHFDTKRGCHILFVKRKLSRLFRLAASGKTEGDKLSSRLDRPRLGYLTNILFN
jgi:hypothetical protein